MACIFPQGSTIPRPLPSMLPTLVDPKCSPCLSALPPLTIRHCRVRAEKTAQSGSGHLTVRVPRKYDVLPLFPITRTSVPRLNQPRAVSRAQSHCHCNYKHQQHSCPELSRQAWMEGKGQRRTAAHASISPLHTSPGPGKESWMEHSMQTVTTNTASPAATPSPCWTLASPITYPGLCQLWELKNSHLPF